MRPQVLLIVLVISLCCCCCTRGALPGTPLEVRLRVRQADADRVRVARARAELVAEAKRSTANGVDVSVLAARALGRALGKRASASARRPVFLVPGVAGSTLLQKLQNVSQPHYICSNNMDWTRLWLRVSTLVPYEFDCLANTLSMVFGKDNRWHEKPGVSTATPPGLNAIDYLDDADLATRRLTRYYELTTEALVAAGFRVNSTLFGLPFDWRRVPEDHTDMWRNLTATVEQSVNATGLRADLVSHSMGGLYMHYFLAEVVTPAWKQRYINAWYALGAPFAGAPIAVKALLSGYNFDIPVVTSAEGLAVGQNFGTTFLLNPKPDAGWGTLVAAHHALNNTWSNFTAADLGDLYTMAGLADGPSKLYWSTRSWSMSDPGLDRVVLVAGSTLNTDSSFVYDAANFGAGPKAISTTSGDGTVPLGSAMFPLKLWNNTSAQVFPGVDHVGLLRDAAAVKWLVDALLQ